ncbi:uncharacterized protein LOC124142563 [Haliotis rufescens]|uniref:uncharacterized protein LOC124142563 n=1 Tax=Haliotis rufescens TaxID=6454 RepID=UPI00201E991E|nr:uncharacterized protein LOC124142563 [Haliotis rufescens]
MVAMAASTSFIRHLVFIVNMIVFEPFLIKGDVPFNQCGDPPPVPNTYRTFPDNVTVTYRCMDNFILTSGNRTRVCEDGNYTGEAPVCNLTCGPPFNTTESTGILPDNVDGYIENSVTYLCGIDGVGNGTRSTCSKIQEGWDKGDRCYHPLNTSNVLCHDNGVNCSVNFSFFYDIHKVSISIPAFSNENMTIKLSIQDWSSEKTYNKSTNETVFEIVFNNSRYGISGKSMQIQFEPAPDNTTIQHGNFQMYARPVAHVDCGRPQHIPHANIISWPDSTRHGDHNRTTYACIEGFTSRAGPEYSTCGRNGNWRKSIVCTDDMNYALDRTVKPDYAWKLTDGNISSCQTNLQNESFIIDLVLSLEVSDVSVVFSDEFERKPNVAVSVGVATPCATGKPGHGKILNIPCAFYPVGRNITVNIVHQNHGEPVDVCEIYVYGRPYTEALECYRQSKQRDYKGTMNMTVMGIPCQRWDNHSHIDASQFPDDTLTDAVNFCRDPIKRGHPWCYTVDPQIEWQYCPVKHCDDVCLQHEHGRTYRGSISHTSSGEECVKWKQHGLPFFSHFSEKKPHCRNPLVSQAKPWCYTKRSGSSNGHCYIPTCPITSNITWDHWVMDENQTLSDLASATECFVWNFEAMSPQEKDYSRKITSSEGHYHNFTNQMCKPGAVYNMAVFCWNSTSDGTYWTTGWIECVDCSKPPDVTNANVIYNKTLIHSRAVYACLPGYNHTAGSDETTCLRTGDWEHPNMTCTRTSSTEHYSNKKCVKLGAQCYCRPVKQRLGIEDIKRLRLKITSLHSYKIKKISMPDTRKMSQGIGFLAIAIITCTFGIFIVPDVISCLVNVKRFCRRLCK